MADPKLKGFGFEVKPPPTPPILKGFGFEVKGLAPIVESTERALIAPLLQPLIPKLITQL